MARRILAEEGELTKNIESADLQRAIAQGKIGAARDMDAGQKLLAGARLFDVVRHRANKAG